MADFVFNIAKGMEAYYASLPAAADALVWVPLEAAGLQGDAALKDYDTLAALLAGSSNEQLLMGRQAASAVTVTVDDANDAKVIDCGDVSWSAASGNPTGKLLLCYEPDTGAADDAAVVPLAAYDFVASPSGVNIVAQVASGGAVTVS